ncbi:MAG TPA: hypothetical protein VD814_00115 [Nocardioides sp.]|nr:hypothetical protein [Nocardioides sp.]
MPVRRDPAGRRGPTPGQARGPGWRQTSWGFHVPSWVDRSVPEQRIVEAAAVLPAYGGVTGWAALRWWGGVWFDGLAVDGVTELPVVLAVSECDIRCQPGIEVSAEALDPRELASVDGLRLTTVERALVFEVRYARDERTAAVMVDMAAYSDLVDLVTLTSYVSRQPALTGIPQARRAVALAEENSWSPWESRMRLAWELDAGLPRPLCNIPVFDRSGRHLGTPDLLDPEAGLVAEYDGGLHLLGRQRRHDRDREEELRRHGLEYLTVLGGDVLDGAHLASRIHRVRARARFEAESARSWTTEPPPWWVPTATVEQRRRLTDRQQARLLRLRRRTG